jgi:hypothetical protein
MGSDLASATVATTGRPAAAAGDDTNVRCDVSPAFGAVMQMADVVAVCPIGQEGRRALTARCRALRMERGSPTVPSQAVLCHTVGWFDA